MSNEYFQGAHDFMLHQTVNVTAGSGLEKLYKASMPEAFHDSGSRDPPHCHPGTRVDYIDKISNWGTGASQQHLERILWMEGPAGVGKSAIAQTCAELLAEQNHLGAAFFFSRPNQRDDPKRLFPSISYQITTISDAYADILDRKLQRNPNLLEKSLESQFHELLVKPLQEANGTKEYVIIIDGLDECAGINAQREIIATISKSVQDGTTPFRWAFFSRPESHIAASFASDRIHPISFHLELPVSRKIDHEILCYLTDELKKLQQEYGLPSSWPSERDLGILVDRSAGLYIYASTVIRVVGDRNSWGPIAQLRRVISPTERATSDAISIHPLSALDLFYMFILECVPPNTLLLLQKILLINDVIPPYYPNLNPRIWGIANILGLSEPEFRNACAVLRSVLKADSKEIHFYHASFMDFLKDPRRSQEFCIYGTCLDTTRQELLELLNLIHAQSTKKLTFDLAWSISAGYGQDTIYRCCVDTFFHLCSYPRPLPPSTAAGLVEFSFMMIPRLHRSVGCSGYGITLEAFRQNIPTGLRNKVIRRGLNPVVFLYKPSSLPDWNGYYVLGQRRAKVVCWPKLGEDYCHLRPYPSVLKI